MCNGNNSGRNGSNGRRLVSGDMSEITLNFVACTHAEPPERVPHVATGPSRSCQ